MQAARRRRLRAPPLRLHAAAEPGLPRRRQREHGRPRPRLENALNRLARRGRLVSPTGTALNLWLTEFGYFARKETGREKVFPESTRAKYLVQAFEMARKDPRVEVMLQFLLVEYPKGMFRFNTVDREPQRQAQEDLHEARVVGPQGAARADRSRAPGRSSSRRRRHHAPPPPPPQPQPTPVPPTPPPPDPGCINPLPPLPPICP